MNPLRLALAVLLALPLAAAEPPAPEALASQARSLTGNLMLSLQGELFAAMKTGGPVKALEVCRARAPEIARDAAAGTPWRIARTSVKFRNLANAPDAWEAEKLEEFRKRLAAGEGVAAIEAFEVDPLMKQALPPNLHHAFLELRRDEWTRYNAQISQWETDFYLERYP